MCAIMSVKDLKVKVAYHHVCMIGEHKRTCVECWNMLLSDLSLIVSTIGMCDKANAEKMCCFPRLTY